MNRINLWWAVLVLFGIDHRQAFVSSFTTPLTLYRYRYRLANQNQNQNENNISKHQQSLFNVKTVFVSKQKYALCVQLCAASANDDTVTIISTTTTSTSASALTSNNESESDSKASDLENYHTNTGSILLPHTSAIIRISYDGSRFTGWSAANNNGSNDLLTIKKKRRKRNRRRGAVAVAVEESHQQPAHTQLPVGFVRSVEGILKENLARLYGDVDPNTRIVVEGCSRTDKGVHATCMIAQVYCLKEGFSTIASSYGNENENESENDQDENSHDNVGTSSMVIPGKRIPHPATPTDDSCFEACPQGANLSRMAFSFNRMRPNDVQITGIAPTPLMDDKEVFHASLSSKHKTYEYRISTGYLWDPTLRKFVWHVGSSNLDAAKIQQACELLRGRHDFSAFQGAPRGNDEKRKRIEQQQQQQRDSSLSSSSSSSSSASGSICTLYDIRIDVQHPINVHEDYYFPGADPPVQNYNIVVKGDRFLYKMVRFIVGSLVAIGNGKLELEDVQRALETGSWDIPQDPSGRRKQFKCAPAHGLTLTHVDYGDRISFDWQILRDPTEGRGKR